MPDTSFEKYTEFCKRMQEFLIPGKSHLPYETWVKNQIECYEIEQAHAEGWANAG